MADTDPNHGYWHCYCCRCAIGPTDEQYSYMRGVVCGPCADGLAEIESWYGPDSDGEVMATQPTATEEL